MKKIVALVAVAALVAFAAPALAANPFMDVPMNSWAYDAVSQLSASGVVSGYPDGTFKGNQPMTRYEMASIVARSLATVDMNKASKQDVEMLKKLVVEFKDELDALGVKVDSLDSRVAVLEENLGGWKIAGGFRFDYSKVDEPGSGFYKKSTGDWNDQDNTLSRARLHFYKTINENVKFYGRLNGEDPEWMRYRIDVKLPYDTTLRVGKFSWDWESDMYWVSPPGSWQTDGIMSDYTLKGFHLTKDFSMGTAKFIVSRHDASDAEEEYLLYGADFELNFNEMFGAQLVYINQDPEEGDDLSTWWIAPKVDFGNGMGLKGAFYQQNNDNLSSGYDDASMWRAIFTVDQDVTGFSSFWVEYADADAGFYFNQPAAYGFVAQVPNWNGILPMDTSVFQVMAAQKWNDKWDTWVRYADFDLDGPGMANYTIGVDYLYSDAVRFELLYDKLDGDGDFDDLDDSIINFRTAIYF
jgi:hypothetical protein